MSSCEHCIFFEEFKGNEYGDRAGYCRRYPPQLSSALLTALTAYMVDKVGDDEFWEEMHRKRDDFSNWQWPVVSVIREDWCGEFKQKGDNQ